MSGIHTDVLRSIREILRIGNELRECRLAERRLEKEREEHRERVLEHYNESVRFVTPYGNVLVGNRESPAKFSLEDVRDILQGIEGINEETRAVIQGRFDEEASKLTKTTRTVSVQRQQTLKAKHRKKRKKSQTLKRDSHDEPDKIDKTD